MRIADDAEISEVLSGRLAAVEAQFLAVDQAAQRMDELDVDQMRGVQVAVGAESLCKPGAWGVGDQRRKDR